MGTVVLDASVVIGWLDARDAHHAVAEQTLADHAGGDLRLPASAYAEVLVQPSAAGVVAAVRTALHEVGIHVDPLSEAGAEAAAALRARFPALRLPDALVLGHAEAVDAEAVLTTDAR